MMSLSILAVCVLVPAGFMAQGPFATWLRSIGVHMTPNFAGGTQVAEFSNFSLSLREIPLGMDAAGVTKSLALRRFVVSKVAFRRFSGIGLAPRLNLRFEFEGALPDPQDSPSHFSATTIHVYIRTPSATPVHERSSRTARVDFEDPGWNYQAIIDGFHDQALIYDARGNLTARGLGLYVERPDDSKKITATNASARTTLTAALPMELLGDPSRGDWRFYVVIGLPDPREPSMMLHSAPDSGPSVYCAALRADSRASSRPLLRALEVKN